MRDLVMRALDTARNQGASYADVRIVRLQTESITVRNENVEGLSADETLGFGVRVIAGGYWGFASSHQMTLAEADRVAAQAVRIAKASGQVRGPRANIGPPVVHVDTYRTPIDKDPFAVSLDDKIALLLGANQAMMKVGGIVMAESNLYAQKEDKVFASSEGSYVE
jgi:TldD protein